MERTLRRVIFGHFPICDKDRDLEKRLRALSQTVRDLDLRVTEIERSRDPWEELSLALRGDEGNHVNHSAESRRG